jgi:hypothetical protein
MKEEHVGRPLHRTAAVLLAAMAFGLGAGACGGNGSVTVGRYGEFEVRVPAGWRIGLPPEDAEPIFPGVLPVIFAGRNDVRDSGIIVFRHDGQVSSAEAEEFWRTQFEQADLGPARTSEKGGQSQSLLEGTRLDPVTGDTRHILVSVATLADHPGVSWVVFCDAAREAFLRDCRQFAAEFTIKAAD